MFWSFCLSCHEKCLILSWPLQCGYCPGLNLARFHKSSHICIGLYYLIAISSYLQFQCKSIFVDSGMYSYDGSFTRFCLWRVFECLAIIQRWLIPRYWFWLKHSSPQACVTVLNITPPNFISSSLLIPIIWHDNTLHHESEIHATWDLIGNWKWISIVSNHPFIRMATGLHRDVMERIINQWRKWWSYFSI